MQSDDTTVERPSRLLRAFEGRALWEAGSLLPALPFLASAPRGDGHPVLVIPGWLASDRSTSILRWFLADRGYRAHGWTLDRNEGPTPEVRAGLVRRLGELRDQARLPVSLIGWSLGGIYARALARRFPADVRQVIALASPFRTAEPPGAVMPVPSTSIYTRTDGIVPWRACVDDEGPRRENIEVDSSHLGMGHHPTVLLIVADRLAQPAGEWRRYSARRA